MESCCPFCNTSYSNFFFKIKILFNINWGFFYNNFFCWIYFFNFFCSGSSCSFCWHFKFSLSTIFLS
nr:MAG TPA: hypothetical protein [Bacteriophage sp.]